MPIRPPNLDDRRYDELLAEARALIPQYCPEWTNLGNADPGMTLVQLFAWMTELTIYRLNRVPDKTYIHFLNFIGEERRRAQPAVVPVTFMVKTPGAIEVPAETAVTTRQREDKPSLEMLTVDELTIHDSRVIRTMAVRGGPKPAVREVPFSDLKGNPSVSLFGSGRGVQLFELDSTEYGPEAYTPYQYLYIAHDDFRLMDVEPEEDRPIGRLRIRRASGDALSIVRLFEWEYPSRQGWIPVDTALETEEQLGMPELSLQTVFTGIEPQDSIGMGDQVMPLPDPVADQKWWIRGRLDYERWLADCMMEDLEVAWKDDRGGEERALNNWEVRSSGRTLEFFLQDLPPIRGGWTIRFALVDRSVPAGQRNYLPQYRWYYRRGEVWEEIPLERVHAQGTMVIMTGPLTDMATDGFNLRAERLETIFVRGFAPDLELDLNWQRPVEVSLLCGDDSRRLTVLPTDEGPWSPFQISPVIPPTIGRKFFIGSDLFENRRQAPVLVELEIGFEMNGELIEEPVDLYQMQLTYRAEDSWRVVYSKDKKFSKFAFVVLDKAGAKRAAKRKIRMILDPNTHLKGLTRHEVGGIETTWIRFELIKSSLTGTDDKKEQHPIVPRIYSVQLGAEKTLGDETYEQPLPGPRMAQLDFRERNRRLTRIVTRATGRLSEFFPFYGFVDIEQANLAVYLQFDKPLPVGAHHAIHFRCRGEAFLPDGVGMEWEMLEGRKHGRVGWQRLQLLGEGDARSGYMLTRSGVLEFVLPDAPEPTDHGFWIRGRFTLPEGTEIAQIPSLPPITHVMLNTVNAVNLHTMRTERYSGHGVPGQAIQLLRYPVFVHEDQERSVFRRQDQFEDIHVRVVGDDGQLEDWTSVSNAAMLTAAKDDRVFVVDPVDGTLTFGNGIRGKMLPVGSNNVLVDVYRVVPGARGNVAPHDVVLCEDLGDVAEVTNLLPATGGRDAEQIEEIIRRAPSVLTSRDRAVTRSDFEVIASEASGEVSRAACSGDMGEDGQVEIVVLARPRVGEQVPDPFLSAGLRDHVATYLKRRCLINVSPVVRLARFMALDVSVTLRLRSNANIVHVREAAEAWVTGFLDPYTGGLDGEGWPFNGTLYSQDFARMVTDIPEVRHVVDVRLFELADIEAGRTAVPGWEEGVGSGELQLLEQDLFVVNRVRIQTEDRDL